MRWKRLVAFGLAGATLALAGAARLENARRNEDASRLARIEITSTELRRAWQVFGLTRNDVERHQIDLLEESLREQARARDHVMRGSRPILPDVEQRIRAQAANAAAELTASVESGFVPVRLAGRAPRLE